MYCKVCGKEILDDAIICVHCGCQIQSVKTEEQPKAPTTSTTEAKMNVMALVGFILSIVSLFIALVGIVAIVGLILSIVGLKQIKENKETSKGYGLAIAGIIVNVGSLLYTLYVLVLLGTLVA